MDITYKLLGTDGQHYGPVNLEQLQTWLREGRVSASSQVMRSDGNAWQPASAYTELGLSNPTALPTAAPASAVSDPGATEGLSAEFLQLHRRIKSGGSWFYWIAGLSLINSFAALTGSARGFIVGLNLTQVIDQFVLGTSGGTKTVALVLDALTAALFVLFGVFACKRHVWAFAVGMVLYGIDTLLTVMAGSWLGVAFHGWVLFSLFVGLKAALELNAAARQPAA